MLKLLQKDYTKNSDGYQLKLPSTLETIITNNDFVWLIAIYFTRALKNRFVVEGRVLQAVLESVLEYQLFQNAISLLYQNTDKRINEATILNYIANNYLSIGRTKQGLDTGGILGCRYEPTVIPETLRQLPG